MFKIVAVGAGLAAILGAGSILLSIIGDANWSIFLMTAVLLFLVGMVAKTI